MVLLLYFIFLLYYVYRNLFYGFYAVIDTYWYIWYAWCEDLTYKFPLGNNVMNGIIVYIELYSI